MFEQVSTSFIVGLTKEIKFEEYFHKIQFYRDCTEQNTVNTDGSDCHTSECSENIDALTNNV